MLGNSDVRRQQAALLLRTLTLDLGRPIPWGRPHTSDDTSGAAQEPLRITQRALDPCMVFSRRLDWSTHVATRAVGLPFRAGPGKRSSHTIATTWRTWAFVAYHWNSGLYWRPSAL